MASVKKVKPISIEVIEQTKAMAALRIFGYLLAKMRSELKPTPEGEKEQEEKIKDFEKIYHHSYYDVIIEIWKWYSYILGKDGGTLEEIYQRYVDCVSRVEKEPMQLVKYDGRYKDPKDIYRWVRFDGQKYTCDYEWVFKGYSYEVKGFYSDEEVKLLILESFDQERRYFEKLNAKFNQKENDNAIYERPRIPESVRIEVWRRDSGKCARCGSREKLEYDHIVPISKGGSNTARNIELLCEKCNRSKSNNVV